MPIAAPLWLRTAPPPADTGSSSLATASFTSCSLLRQDQPATLAYYVARANAKAGDLESGIASHDVGKLVIDMRWNNGGDTFLNEPLLQMLRSAGVNRQGHLFVIIGPRTFSAGLNAADYFQRDLNAIFVGEPTGGKPNAPGDETFFALPYSKISINFSSVYWESGWPQDARLSIAPDVYTPRTFAQYLKGDDPAMDAVRRWPGA